MAITTSWSLRRRISTLTALSVLGLILVQGLNVFQELRATSEVVLPRFGDQVLEGNKALLREMVRTEVQRLAKVLDALPSRDGKLQALERETDPLRFFEDGSGYFFSYTLEGVRINVPTNKAKNGQPMLDLQDAKGNAIVRDFITQARAGGGFTTYFFDKPGAGVQPKVAYVAPIPGTDFLVGAGVYIDNVERETARLQGLVQAEQRRALGTTLAVFLALSAALVALGVLVARSANRTISRVTAGLLDASREVAAASASVSTSGNALAEGSASQAAALQETSASMAEVSAMTRKNAEGAERSLSLKQAADRSAAQASTAMEQLQVAMHAITDSGARTSKIIKSIDEIAFQTNLLALNAAVEAARAGEAGAGFAVVAEEVRTLASRSAEAARDTSALIEGTLGTVAQGSKLAMDTGLHFAQLHQQTRSIGEAVEQVARSSREQAQGIEQVNLAIQQMNEVVQKNAARAEESAAAATELDAQSDQMRAYVDELQVLVEGHRQAA